MVEKVDLLGKKRLDARAKRRMARSGGRGKMGLDLSP